MTGKLSHTFVFKMGDDTTGANAVCEDCSEISFVLRENHHYFLVYITARDSSWRLTVLEVVLV